MEHNLTKEEKDYYELLLDFMEDGIVPDGNRNVLNKRREKLNISESRAKELEDYAKKEYLDNLQPNTDNEKNYYELLLDFMEDGIIPDGNRNVLNKRREKLNISESRAKELEDYAKKEYLDNLKPKNDNEKDYYELLSDFIENGRISDNNRSILEKRREKLNISDSRAKELESLLTDNSFNSESNDLIELGKSYINNKEYDKAIETLLKAIELDPNNYIIWHLLGFSYYMDANEGEGEYRDMMDKAIESFEKACSLNPNDDNNWYWLGEAFSIFHIDKQIKAFENACRLNPNSDNNWSGLGIAYFNNGQYDESIEALKKACDLNPNYYYHWYMLASPYKNMNQNEKAIEVLEKACDLASENPDNGDPWHSLGEVYNKQGRYEEAIEAFKKACDIEPEFSLYWSSLSDAYYNNEEYYESIEALIEAINYNRSFTEYRIKLGDRLEEQGMYDQALNCFLKIYDMEEYNCENLKRLGNIYYKLENYAESVTFYEKVLEEDEDVLYDDVSSMFNYGIALANLNRIEESKAIHMKILEDEPDNETALNNLKILNSSNSIWNKEISGKDVINGISKGIDTVNELYKKVDPEVVKGIIKVIGKFI